MLNRNIWGVKEYEAKKNQQLKLWYQLRPRSL